MPTEKQPQKDQIKVTDKRMFTADGEIREEFRGQIQPADPQSTPAPAAEPSTPPPSPAPPPAAAAPEPPREPQPQKHAAPSEERRTKHQGPPSGGERRRTVGERAENPGTPFTNFIESLVIQTYMALGMLRNPYSPAPPEVNPEAAREIIDIVTMLREKTHGNLTPEEEDFLETHLAELKLAFVQRTKTI